MIILPTTLAKNATGEFNAIITDVVPPPPHDPFHSTQVFHSDHLYFKHILRADMLDNGALARRMILVFRDDQVDGTHTVWTGAAYSITYWGATNIDQIFGADEFQFFILTVSNNGTQFKGEFKDFTFRTADPDIESTCKISGTFNVVL
ncbi:hypothetical protein [Pseudomonas sp. DR208]|uniref:hypothetical protein n=1 Tax=Pseudomonas sp. DR208 TaxID=2870840 RepID=UPI001C99824F|nr:hypothetical protein [Pseudomonas sp. DR208]QZP18825.1 hypothetical protein K5K89_15895 [Pseudomonas sp. DR208]